MIFRLIGLMAVFCLLNALWGQRFFPSVSGVNGVYHIHLPLVAIGTLGFAFLAGISWERFCWFFLPLAIVVFTLLPCLPLFQDYPRFFLFIASLVGVVHFTLWSVFSTAVAEQYRGRFWFYACAVVMYICKSLSFHSLLLERLFPSSLEIMALSATIASVSFTLLSFKILFSGKPVFNGAIAAPPVKDPAAERERLFAEHGLTEREREVAALMLEGLDNGAIGDKLCISVPAVRYHIGNIYGKFGVDGKRGGRSAFLVKVMQPTPRGGAANTEHFREGLIK
jgi:DNA-binding CsgD family transcriptional regulator